MIHKPGTQARTAAAAANKPTTRQRPSISNTVSAYKSPRSSLPEYPPRTSTNPGSRRPSASQRFIPNHPLTNNQETISAVYRPLTRQQRPSIFKGSRAGTRSSRRPTLSDADTFWPLQRTLSNLSLSPITKSSSSDETSPFRPVEKTPQGVVRPFTSDKPPVTRKPLSSFLSASPVPLPNITPDSTLRAKIESRKAVKSESPLSEKLLDAQKPLIPAIPLSDSHSAVTSPLPKSQVSTQRDELPEIEVRCPSRPIPPFSIKAVRNPPSKVLINIHPPIKQTDTTTSRPDSSTSTIQSADEPNITIESLPKFDSPYNQANKLTGMDSAKPAFTIKPTPAAAAAKAADVNSRRGSGKDVATDADSDDPNSKTTFTIKPMTSSTPKGCSRRQLDDMYTSLLHLPRSCVWAETL
ncbi:hypothetical protein PoB_003188100 [Plakobranchus ocellatus]|uniref:Uncharacterized protein n=1 Tax=Plakobranchus ocellatus TaxID=259542 RepID=A0AAV4AAL8_9GAST|nr:hypothetical protein PoB_003188100 [Plakobranchus ocellatus]